MQAGKVAEGSLGQGIGEQGGRSGAEEAVAVTSVRFYFPFLANLQLKS